MFELVDVGTAPDSHDGDPIRTAFQRVNSNFATATGVVATRDELALIPTWNRSPHYVFGAKGWFYFSTSNLALRCTADTKRGLHIAPYGEDGSNGAWLRHFDGPWVFDWFEDVIPGDYATGLSPDCLESWLAVQHLVVTAMRRNQSVSYGAGGPEMLFPSPQYYFSDEMPVYCSMRLRGQGSGMSGSEPTWLRFAADCAGVHVYYDTPDGTSPAGTSIEGFLIQGGGGTHSGVLIDDLTKSGIRCNARTFVKDVTVRNFVGAGLLLSADSGAAVGSEYHGNINGSTAERMRIEQCKSGGALVSGGDGNVIKLDSIDVDYTGRYSFSISPFLAAVLTNCQAAYSGYPSVSGVAEFSLVHYAGVIYQARHNATLAQLQATVPGTNEAIWLRHSAGGASADVPTWDGTGNYVPGGPYGGTGAFVSGTSNYHETGAGLPDMPGAAMIAGFMGSNVGPTPQMNVGDNGFSSNMGWSQRRTFPDGFTAMSAIGGIFTDTWLDLLRWNSGKATQAFDPGRINSLAQHRATGDIRHLFGGAGGVAGDYGVFEILGGQTDRTYGADAAAASNAVGINKLALGFGTIAGGDAKRMIYYSYAAPNSGKIAQGEIRFAATAGAGGKAGWYATVGGTLGSTAVVKPFALIDA